MCRIRRVWRVFRAGLWCPGVRPCARLLRVSPFVLPTRLGRLLPRASQVALPLLRGGRPLWGRLLRGRDDVRLRRAGLCGASGRCGCCGRGAASCPHGGGIAPFEVRSRRVPDRDIRKHRSCPAPPEWGVNVGRPVERMTGGPAGNPARYSLPDNDFRHSRRGAASAGDTDRPTAGLGKDGTSERIGSRLPAACDDRFITGMPGGRDTRCPVSG